MAKRTMGAKDGSTSSEGGVRRRSSNPVAVIRRRFSSRSGGRRPSKRIVFLGACEVGKTAILSRLREDFFPSTYEPTLEEVSVHMMPLQSKEPEAVELVDLTGATEAEYEKVRQKAIVEADGFVVVFSVNSRSSFTRAEGLLRQIESTIGGLSCDNGFRVLLVANRVDEDETDLVEYELLAADRVVSSDDAFQLIDRLGLNDLNYIEVSALSGLGVDDLPRRLTKIFQGGDDKKKKGKTNLSATPSIMMRMKSFVTKSRPDQQRRVTGAPKLGDRTASMPNDVKQFAADDDEDDRQRRRGTWDSNGPSEMSSSGHAEAKRRGLRATLRNTFRRKKRTVVANNAGKAESAGDTNRSAR